MTDDPETGLPPGVPAAEHARLRAENARLRKCLATAIAWADRHGKEPDWLADARAACGVVCEGCGGAAIGTDDDGVDLCEECGAALAAARPETGTAGGGGE